MEKKEVQILEFSPEEAALGARYALEECRHRIKEERLRSVANRILLKMREFNKSFQISRKEILDEEGLFPWSYDGPAYNKALGKMFSERNAVKQKCQQKEVV